MECLYNSQHWFSMPHGGGQCGAMEDPELFVADSQRFRRLLERDEAGRLSGEQVLGKWGLEGQINMKRAVV